MGNKIRYYLILSILLFILSCLIILDQNNIALIISSLLAIFSLTLWAKNSSLLFKIFILFILCLVVFPDEFTKGVGFNFVYNRESIFFKNLIYKFRTIDIIMFTGFILFLIIKTPRKLFPIWTPINTPILLFFIWLPVPVLKGILHGGTTNLFAGWKNFFLGILFFIIFLEVMDSKRKIEYILWMFFIIVLLNDIYALVKLALGKGISTKLGHEVPFFYNSADIFVSISCFLFGIGLLLNRKMSIDKTIFLISGCIIFFLTIAISFRRSLWLQLVIGICLLVYYSRARVKMKAMIYFLLIMGIFPFFLDTKIIPISINNLTESAKSLNILNKGIGVHYISNQRHLENIYIALQVLIKEGLFLGYGIGRDWSWSTVYNFASIHNGIIKTWFWFGIVGLMSYLLLFLSFFINYQKNLKYFSNETKALTIGYFGFIVSWFIISSAFTPPFYTSFSTSIIMFFHLSVILSMIKYNNEEAYKYDANPNVAGNGGQGCNQVGENSAMIIH